jgi:hypothetical protein
MKMKDKSLKVNVKAFVNASKPVISSLQIEIPADEELSKTGELLEDS